MSKRFKHAKHTDDKISDLELSVVENGEIVKKKLHEVILDSDGSVNYSSPSGTGTDPDNKSIITYEALIRKFNDFSFDFTKDFDPTDPLGQTLIYNNKGAKEFVDMLKLVFVGKDNTLGDIIDKIADGYANGQPPATSPAFEDGDSLASIKFVKEENAKIEFANKRSEHAMENEHTFADLFNVSGLKHIADPEILFTRGAKETQYSHVEEAETQIVSGTHSINVQTTSSGTPTSTIIRLLDDHGDLITKEVTETIDGESVTHNVPVLDEYIEGALDTSQPIDLGNGNTISTTTTSPTIETANAADVKYALDHMTSSIRAADSYTEEVTKVNDDLFIIGSNYGTMELIDISSGTITELQTVSSKQTSGYLESIGDNLFIKSSRIYFGLIPGFDQVSVGQHPDITDLSELNTHSRWTNGKINLGSHGAGVKTLEVYEVDTNTKHMSTLLIPPPDFTGIKTTDFGVPSLEYDGTNTYTIQFMEDIAFTAVVDSDNTGRSKLSLITCIFNKTTKKFEPKAITKNIDAEVLRGKFEKVFDSAGKRIFVSNTGNMIVVNSDNTIDTYKVTSLGVPMIEYDTNKWITVDNSSTIRLVSYDFTNHTATELDKTSVTTSFASKLGDNLYYAWEPLGTGNLMFSIENDKIVSKFSVPSVGLADDGIYKFGNTIFGSTRTSFGLLNNFKKSTSFAYTLPSHIGDHLEIIHEYEDSHTQGIAADVDNVFMEFYKPEDNILVVRWDAHYYKSVYTKSGGSTSVNDIPKIIPCVGYLEKWDDNGTERIAVLKNLVSREHIKTVLPTDNLSAIWDILQGREIWEYHTDNGKIYYEVM